MTNTPRTPEQAKAMRETMAREVWLLYFNHVLYTKGLITEKQKNQMKNKISSLSRPAHDPCRS